VREGPVVGHFSNPVNHVGIRAAGRFIKLFVLDSVELLLAVLGVFGNVLGIGQFKLQGKTL
jgi:hypothetical protein